MTRIFGVDLPAVFAGTFRGQTQSATLIRIEPGTRTSGALTAGTNPTSTSYTAEGLVEFYTAKEVDGDRIKVGDRKIALFGSTIEGAQVPEPNDQITIDGSTYLVVDVGYDYAAAIYTCQGRKPGV